jgi:hypothetical protein
MGAKLSSWVAANPLASKAMSHLPAAAEDFLMGRVADVGESIATTAIFAVQNGDQSIGQILSNFPAAVVANFAEEIVIDMLPFGKGGPSTYTEARLNSLALMKTTVEQRIVELEKSDLEPAKKKKLMDPLLKSRALIDRAYDKRKELRRMS